MRPVDIVEWEAGWWWRWRREANAVAIAIGASLSQQAANDMRQEFFIADSDGVPEIE